MGLDERLYEFAHRLSDEQLRSVVWDEENNSDVCAAADVASVAAVLVGTVRVALVYVPWVSDGLRLACGGGRVSEEGEEEE